MQCETEEKSTVARSLGNVGKVKDSNVRHPVMQENRALSLKLEFCVIQTFF